MEIIEVRNYPMKQGSVLLKMRQPDGSIEQLIKHNAQTRIKIELPSNTNHLNSAFVIELKDNIGSEDNIMIVEDDNISEHSSNKKTILNGEAEEEPEIVNGEVDEEPEMEVITEADQEPEPQPEDSHFHEYDKSIHNYEEVKNKRQNKRFLDDDKSDRISEDFGF